MQVVLSHFSHSTQAKGKLAVVCKELGITIDMQQISKT
jgi:hypothetical protein